MRIEFENRTYFVYNFKTLNLSGISENTPFMKEVYKIYIIFISSNGKRNLSFLLFSEKELPDIYLCPNSDNRPGIIVFSDEFDEYKTAISFPQDPLFTVNVPTFLKNKETSFFQKILKQIRKP